MSPVQLPSATLQGAWETRGQMFWDMLSESDRDAISAIGARKKFDVGSRLFFDGDAPTHAVVILRGLVKLTRTSKEGREIMIELRGPGHLLGELAAIDSIPRSAAATVVEDVEAIVFSAADFRGLLRQRSSLSFAVLTIVTEKLRQATDRRLEAGVGDAQARLCGRLCELAASTEPDPDGVIEVKSPLTQQELADWIGVSRDAIVLALRRIRELRWIETGRRTIRILDIEALRKASLEAY